MSHKAYQVALHGAKATHPIACFFQATHPEKHVQTNFGRGLITNIFQQRTELNNFTTITKWDSSEPAHQKSLCPNDFENCFSS